MWVHNSSKVPMPSTRDSVIDRRHIATAKSALNAVLACCDVTAKQASSLRNSTSTTGLQAETLTDTNNSDPGHTSHTPYNLTQDSTYITPVSAHQMTVSHLPSSVKAGYSVGQTAPLSQSGIKKQQIPSSSFPLNSDLMQPVSQVLPVESQYGPRSAVTPNSSYHRAEPTVTAPAVLHGVRQADNYGKTSSTTQAFTEYSEGDNAIKMSHDQSRGETDTGYDNPRSTCTDVLPTAALSKINTVFNRAVSALADFSTPKAMAVAWLRVRHELGGPALPDSLKMEPFGYLSSKDRNTVCAALQTELGHEPEFRSPKIFHNIRDALWRALGSESKYSKSSEEGEGKSQSIKSLQCDLRPEIENPEFNEHKFKTHIESTDSLNSASTSRAIYSKKARFTICKALQNILYHYDAFKTQSACDYAIAAVRYKLGGQLPPTGKKVGYLNTLNTVKVCKELEHVLSTQTHGGYVHVDDYLRDIISEVLSADPVPSSDCNPNESGPSLWLQQPDTVLRKESSTARRLPEYGTASEFPTFKDSTQEIPPTDLHNILGILENVLLQNSDIPFPKVTNGICAAVKREMLGTPFISPKVSNFISNLPSGSVRHSYEQFRIQLDRQCEGLSADACQAACDAVEHIFCISSCRNDGDNIDVDDNASGVPYNLPVPVECPSFDEPPNNYTISSAEASAVCDILLRALADDPVFCTPLSRNGLCAAVRRDLTGTPFINEHMRDLIDTMSSHAVNFTLAAFDDQLQQHTGVLPAWVLKSGYDTLHRILQVSSNVVEPATATNPNRVDADNSHNQRPVSESSAFFDKWRFVSDTLYEVLIGHPFFHLPKFVDALCASVKRELKGKSFPDAREHLSSLFGKIPQEVVKDIVTKLKCALDQDHHDLAEAGSKAVWRLIGPENQNHGQYTSDDARKITAVLWRTLEKHPDFESEGILDAVCAAVERELDGSAYPSMRDHILDVVGELPFETVSNVCAVFRNELVHDKKNFDAQVCNAGYDALWHVLGGNEAVNEEDITVENVPVQNDHLEITTISPNKEKDSVTFSAASLDLLGQALERALPQNGDFASAEARQSACAAVRFELEAEDSKITASTKCAGYLSSKDRNTVCDHLRRDLAQLPEFTSAKALSTVRDALWRALGRKEHKLPTKTESQISAKDSCIPSSDACSVVSVLDHVLGSYPNFSNRKDRDAVCGTVKRILEGNTYVPASVNKILNKIPLEVNRSICNVLYDKICNECHSLSPEVCSFVRDTLWQFLSGGHQELKTEDTVQEEQSGPDKQAKEETPNEASSVATVSADVAGQDTVKEDIKLGTSEISNDKPHLPTDASEGGKSPHKTVVCSPFSNEHLDVLLSALKRALSRLNTFQTDRTLNRACAAVHRLLDATYTSKSEDIDVYLSSKDRNTVCDSLKEDLKNYPELVSNKAQTLIRDALFRAFGKQTSKTTLPVEAEQTCHKKIPRKEESSAAAEVLSKILTNHPDFYTANARRCVCSAVRYDMDGKPHINALIRKITSELTLETVKSICDIYKYELKSKDIFSRRVRVNAVRALWNVLDGDKHLHCESRQSFEGEHHRQDARLDRSRSPRARYEDPPHDWSNRSQGEGSFGGERYYRDYACEGPPDRWSDERQRENSFGDEHYYQDCNDRQYSFSESYYSDVERDRHFDTEMHYQGERSFSRQSRSSHERRRSVDEEFPYHRHSDGRHSYSRSTYSSGERSRGPDRGFSSRDAHGYAERPLY